MNAENEKLRALLKQNNINFAIEPTVNANFRPVEEKNEPTPKIVITQQIKLKIDETVSKQRLTRAMNFESKFDGSEDAQAILVFRQSVQIWLEKG